MEQLSRLRDFTEHYYSSLIVTILSKYICVINELE